MVRHNRNIRFSASARQDFVTILRYTLATWGEAQMLRYRETLETGLDNLADNPQLGLLRQELSQEYRSIRIAAHVMIYRLDGEAIYIIRILHNRMDPATQLAE